MIPDEAIKRLANVIGLCARTSRAAISAFGVEPQMRMAVEEMGELLSAIARRGRGRSSDGDVVNECADVIITTIQVAMLHSRGHLDPLINALAHKQLHLRATIDARCGAGAEEGE